MHTKIAKWAVSLSAIGQVITLVIKLWDKMGLLWILFLILFLIMAGSVFVLLKEKYQEYLSFKKYILTQKQGYQKKFLDLDSQIIDRIETKLMEYQIIDQHHQKVK